MKNSMDEKSISTLQRYSQRLGMLFPAAGNITPDGWEPYSHTVGNTVSVRPGIYRYCKDCFD